MGFFLDMVLTSDRLILRRFTEDDLDAFWSIMRDEDVNRFLPWYPLKRRDDAAIFLRERYLEKDGYHFAICLKSDSIPIGYINISSDDNRDLGYGLRKEFWHMGIATEAGRLIIERAKSDGVPYLTATHDKNNPNSGNVMQKLSMSYKYTYQELWMPKNFLVDFRMYQINLDGNEERTFMSYWNQNPIHYIEKEVK